MSDTTRDRLEEFAAGYLRLVKLLADLGDSQWEPGRTPTPRDDTTERTIGTVSDPVPGVAGDPRRIKLRDNVLKAEAALLAATVTMSAVERHLHEALVRWQG